MGNVEQLKQTEPRLSICPLVFLSVGRSAQALQWLWVDLHASFQQERHFPCLYSRHERNQGYDEWMKLPVDC